MAVDRIRHGVVVTADVRENRPKMKLDNNQVFRNAISFPDGALRPHASECSPPILKNEGMVCHERKPVGFAELYGR